MQALGGVEVGSPHDAEGGLVVGHRGLEVVRSVPHAPLPEAGREVVLQQAPLLGVLVLGEELERLFVVRDGRLAENGSWGDKRREEEEEEKKKKKEEEEQKWSKKSKAGNQNIFVAVPVV